MTPSQGDAANHVGIVDLAQRLAACEEDRQRLSDWFDGATHSALTAIYVLRAERDAQGHATGFRFEFANANGAALLQRAGHEVRDLRLEDVLPPSRRAVVPAQCLRVMATGLPLVEEFEVPEFPPETRWLRHQVVPLRDGVVISAENISARKQAERDLEQRAEWFRAAAEGNLNALFIEEAVFDDAGEVVDFRFVHVNEQGGRLVGMETSAMVGRSICELFPVNRTHGYFERYREVFLTQRTVVDEFPIDVPGMRARWLRQLAVPWSRGVALSAEDITAEVERKRELEQRQRTLNAFLEHVPGPAWIADGHGMIRICNSRFAALAPPGVIEPGGGASLEAIFGPSLGAIYHANNLQVLATGETLHTIEHGPREDGRTGTYDVHKFPLGDATDRLVGGFAIDVTEREKLQRHANLLGAISRESHDAIYAKSAGGTILEWSPSAERLYGYRADQVLGQPAAILAPADRLGESATLVARALAGEPVVRHRTRRRRADGGEFAVELTMARFRTHDDGEPSVAVLVTDISARLAAEARAEFLSSHDAATGHLNREGLHALLARRPAGGDGLLVARISLREVETLRELLGPPLVDALVKSFADRLVAGLAEASPQVARDGPDELMLALDGGAAAEAHLVAAWPGLVGPVEHEGQHYTLCARMGYAAGGAGEDIASLLRGSDIAHGVALARQSAAPTRFEPGMAEQLARRVEIQRELSAAVDAGELYLVFQPVLDDGEPPRVVGLEALVRWTSPRLGVVSPGEFIPVAEESSAIVAVGDWVLQAACAELRALADAGHAGLFVAVNVAEAQLARPDFTARVAELLARHGLAPAQLELEITERTLMVDSGVHQQNLLDLRRLGVRLSVDDFGTGYSSLAYLMRFAVDKIKVDRSFVAGVDGDGHHAAVVRAMVALAEAMGLGCVSEGVETAGQLGALRRLGCREFQGFHLARPMAPDALRPWLAGAPRPPR